METVVVNGKIVSGVYVDYRFVLSLTSMKECLSSLAVLFCIGQDRENNLV